MKLFFKIAIALSLVFVFLAGVTGYVLQSTFMSRFQEIENSVSVEYVQSVRETINKQVEPLAALAIDYGHWDETYAFVQNKNPTYATEHVGFSTFSKIGIDGAYFYDLDHNLIWRESYGDDFDIAIDAQNLPHRILGVAPGTTLGVDSNSEGVLTTLDGNVLIAASPILHNDSTGPAVGLVVMVRRMDREFFADLEEQTRFLTSMSSQEMELSCSTSPSSINDHQHDDGIALCHNEAGIFIGQAFLFNPQGNPSVVINVTLPREISAVGESGIQYAFAALGIASLIAILTVGLVLSRIVIRPISRLSAIIRRVDESADLSARSSIATKDEIGALSRDLNSMLDKLAASQDNLKSARQFAEVANKAKSEFLAMMSHEIRTPLNGVIGMAEILQNGELTVDQNMKVEIIETSGRSLLDILNNILDLSKLEAGRIDCHNDSLDVEGLINSSLSAMQPAAAGTGIVFSTKIDPGVPICFVSDPDKLRQILQNYIGNAIKFTPGGAITLHVSLEGAAESDVDYIRFAVEDTGIGISEEARKTLFQRFVQADSSISREFGGTGLGLAICKELASLLEGEVGCESTVDVGSSFWLRLPAHGANYDSTPASQSQETKTQIRA